MKLSTAVKFIGILIIAVNISACGRVLSEVLQSSVGATKPKEQASCNFVQNIYNERISWKKNLPIHLQIHESVPPEFYSSIESALKDWEQALNKNLFVIDNYSAKGPLDPRQDGANVIYWMNQWESGRKTEQARTLVYWLGNTIKEADIRINARDFSYYVSNAKSTRDVHLESLLVHEFGHLLGLKHNDAANSVMATSLAALTVRTQIPQQDQESMRCEY